METVLADGSRGHALVFSTVAEGERLVTQYIHPEERGSVRNMLSLEKVQERLDKTASFKVHCRDSAGWGALLLFSDCT